MKYLNLKDPDYLPWTYSRIILFTCGAIGGVFAPVFLMFYWKHLDAEEYLVLSGISLGSLLVLFICWIAIKNIRSYRNLIRTGVVTSATLRNHKVIKTVSTFRSRSNLYLPAIDWETRTSFHYEGEVVFRIPTGETSLRFKSISLSADHESFKSPDFKFQIVYSPDDASHAAYLPSDQISVLQKINKSLVWTLLWLVTVTLISTYLVFYTLSDIFYFSNEPYWPGFALIPLSLIIYLPISISLLRRTRTQL